MSTFKLIGWLLENISAQRKLQGIALLILSIIGSILEIVSIGLLLPVLAFMVNPNKSSMDLSWLDTFISVMPSGFADEGVVLGVVFSIAILLSSLYRIFLIWIQVHWGNAVGHDLSTLVFRRSIYQKYEDHFLRNTSELVSAITMKINQQLIGGFVNPLVSILSSSILILGIASVLVYLSGMMIVGLIFFIAVLYFAVMLVVRGRLKHNSEVIASSSNKIVKHLQESYQGIREVILNGIRNKRVDGFRDLDFEFRAAQTSSVVLSQAPRYLIEAFVVVLMVSVALVLLGKASDIGELLPLVGVMALGLQRIMPLSQAIYANYATIKAASVSSEGVFEILDVEVESDEVCARDDKAIFTSELTLRSVCYSYPGSVVNQLSDISFTVKKGQRLGIFGATGSGKSTLLDVLCGLLEPSSGSITIDGVALTRENQALWRESISVVSQASNFMDASIKSNVAMGVDSVDDARLKMCLEAAQLKEVVNELPNGVETIIGERGGLLSGGQLQRLSVARALYKESEVLVFDEATSALDVETESRVIEAINNLSPDMTIIVVAHRLNTLKDCDLLLKLENGWIDNMGSFAELVGDKNNVKLRG